MLGGLLTGMGLLREPTLPSWIGAALLVVAALMLGFNAQNTRSCSRCPSAWPGVLFGHEVWRSRPDR